MKCIDRLYKKKFVFALLISTLTLIVVSLFSGFRFTYYTNDDYQLSMWIVGGEKNPLFLNYFFTSFLVAIQKLIPKINCFSIAQMIGCFFSGVVINYILLKKCSKTLGIVISFLIDLFIGFFKY